MIGKLVPGPCRTFMSLLIFTIGLGVGVAVGGMGVDGTGVSVGGTWICVSDSPVVSETVEPAGVEVKVGTGVLVDRGGSTDAFRGPHAENSRTTSKKVNDGSKRIV